MAGDERRKRRKEIKMSYKSKLRDLLRKERALQEEKQELLRPIVSAQTITVYKIPKTEKELSELMKKVLNNGKCSWLDLRIVNISGNDIFIFGRRRFILSNLEKIAKIIETGKGCKIGDVGVSFSALASFNLGDFI